MFDVQFFKFFLISFFTCLAFYYLLEEIPFQVEVVKPQAIVKDWDKDVFSAPPSLESTSCMQCCPHKKIKGQFVIDETAHICECDLEGFNYQCLCKRAVEASIFNENGTFKNKEDQAEYENRK